MDETIELAQYAEKKKADYAVLMPGYITRTRHGSFTRRGITNNVMAVIEETNDIKVILYTHPGMTGGKDMRAATWKKLANHPRIPALKASACDARGIRHYQKAAHGNAKVYVGDVALGLRIYSDGIVAGDANILPVAWSMASRRGLDRDTAEGMIADELIRFQQFYAENPIGAFKYILHRQGVISSDETFDPRLKVSRELGRRLGQLMLDESFKRLYALNHQY